jgi:predicted ATPase
MIREISLSNIRVFDGDKWSFKISPLTIFCGTNSAGKSTVLKTLLLLQQTIGAVGESLKRRGYLRFSGRYVDLGDYDALVSEKLKEKPIRIGIVVGGRFPPWIKDDLDKVIGASRAKAVSRREFELRVDFTFVHSSVIASGAPRSAAEPAEVDPIEPFISPEFGHGLLASARYELRALDEVFRWDVAINTSQQRGTLPRYKISLLKALFQYVFMETSGGEGASGEYGTYDVDLDGIVPSTIRISRDQLAKSALSPNLVNMRVPLPSIVEFSIQRLRSDLQNIHYLGPLRSPGRRYYTLNPEYSSDFDAAGEFLPYILRDRRHEQVSYCSPTNLFKSKVSSLEEALNEWLSFLKHGQQSSERGDSHVARTPEFESEFQKQVLGELRLRGRTANTHALVDTGFGYSQVLPVLVRGLLTPPGGMLIVEQPELHLHPALQVRLGAFFIAMATADRTVVLETHSEHLVNALRTVAAESPESTLAERIKVHFIEGTEVGPKLYDLSVAMDGTIPAMPASFFGEGIALSGRLLRAQRRHLKRPAKEN